MSNDAYRNALARKRALLQEIREIEKFLSLYERFSGTKPEDTELLPPSDFPDAIRTTPTSLSALLSGKKRHGYPQKVANAVERILRDSGRPMNRNELAVELESRGVAIPSDDKGRYIGTILWRQAKRFRNIEGRGYWLQNEELPD